MVETLHKRLREVVCVLISSLRDVLYFEISIKLVDSKIRLFQNGPLGLIQKTGLFSMSPSRPDQKSRHHEKFTTSVFVMKQFTHNTTHNT